MRLYACCLVQQAQGRGQEAAKRPLPASRNCHAKSIADAATCAYTALNSDRVLSGASVLHRKVEVSHRWFNRFRRIHTRWEKRQNLYPGFALASSADADPAPLHH